MIYTMQVKKLSILVIVLFVFLSLAGVALAKRILPQAKTGASTGSVGAFAAGKVGVTVKFRGDRRAIIVSFSNLTSARIVNYTLSYNTRGTTQGAGGTIDPGTTGATASRELLFGTCSHGVCRYDTGITNARLVVTYTLANGKRYSKSFRLKV